MNLDGWDVVLWVHLLAMAFFIGGQLFLGIAVVPVFRAQGGSESPATDWMRPIARRFGWGSLVALAVALVTGAAMASDQNLWQETALNIKMTLVVIAIVRLPPRLRHEGHQPPAANVDPARLAGDRARRNRALGCA